MLQSLLEEAERLERPLVRKAVVGAVRVGQRHSGIGVEMRRGQRMQGRAHHREQGTLRRLASQHRPAGLAVPVEALRLEVEHDGPQRREAEAVERRELHGRHLAQPELGVHLAEGRVQGQEGDLQPALLGQVGERRVVDLHVEAAVAHPGGDPDPREFDLLHLEAHDDRLGVSQGRPRVDVGPGAVGVGCGEHGTTGHRTQGRITLGGQHQHVLGGLAGGQLPAERAERLHPKAHRLREGVRGELPGDTLLGEGSSLRRPPVPEGRDGAAGVS